MQNVKVRCVSCSLVYEKTELPGCPQCGEGRYDPVLVMLDGKPQTWPILNFEKMMKSFPRVAGLPVTSKN